MQNDPDDSMLPKIKREQITLAKFLGSGAFGEVNKYKDIHTRARTHTHTHPNLLDMYNLFLILSGVSRKC